MFASNPPLLRLSCGGRIGWSSPLAKRIGISVCGESLFETFVYRVKSVRGIQETLVDQLEEADCVAFPFKLSSSDWLHLYAKRHIESPLRERWLSRSDERHWLSVRL